VLRYLNIEVAAGIVATAVLAARALDVSLEPTWYVVVPLVTWAVYTLDRLLDTRDEKSAPDTGRHRFHARHRRPLFIAVAAALLIAATTAVATFPLSYWLAAIPLGLLTLLHLLLQRTHTRYAAVLKDVNVVVTYTTAAWALPFVDHLQIHGGSALYGNPAFGLYAIVVFVSTLALVLTDVILLSRLDLPTDLEADLPSIARALGTSGLRLLLATLRVIVTVSAVVVIMDRDIASAVVLMVMTAMFVIIERRTFADTDVARIIIEAVLVLPIVLAFIPR